ncbi:hypothetical protein JCM13664_16260 [Methylothermus subterraneus]
MRRVAYLSLALLLNLALFQFMAGLIAGPKLGIKPILHAHPIDFVRLPPPQEPPPERRVRTPPPPPAAPKAPLSSPVSPEPIRGNVRELPTPDLALKVQTSPAPQIPLAAPHLPSLLVEGEVQQAASPVRVPTHPGYISASELVAIVRPPPLYPPEARSRRIEGRVVVEFTVTERGEVQDPVIIEANPPGVFDQAVLETVRKWRFRPKEQNGKPIAVRARQPLEFRLRG